MAAFDAQRRNNRPRVFAESELIDGFGVLLVPTFEKGKVMSSTAYWNQMYANAIDQSEPSQRYRPSLSIDGDQWCALYGDNLQDGVAGFGDSPGAAFWDFDRAWWAKLKTPNV